MKKTTLILALAILATFGTLFSQTPPPQTSPHVVNIQPQPATPVVTPDSPKLEFIGNLTGDTYDWGQVKPKDSPLKTVVVIKNTGKTNLIISEVKPGCGCTSAPISRDTIPSSDTASLSISLNVGGAQGKVTKQIRISSNDPTSPKYLYLAANVIAPIQVTPSQYFTFNNLFPNTKDSCTLTIKNNTKEDISFSDFEVSPATASVSITKPFTLKPTEEIKVTAVVLGEKIGSYSMTFKMKTTNPDNPTFTISGLGNVREPGK